MKKPSNDLLDLDFGHPQISQQPPPPTRTAASGSVQLDPWGTPKQQNTVASNDPWGGSPNTMNIGAPVGEPAYNAERLPTNSDPWSPVQQHNLATAATGAIPRTSPGIGLDNSAKVSDMQRNTVGRYQLVNAENSNYQGFKINCCPKGILIFSLYAVLMFV